MTNLDYEERMSALNQLIHETLGVDINTVRAAYGRARNTDISVRSTASALGRERVSAARRGMLDETALVEATSGAAVARSYKSGMDMPVSRYPVVESMPPGKQRSFLNRFHRARGMDGSEGTPTLRRTSDSPSLMWLTNPNPDAGAFASDWHKLRNEFWQLAQTDRVVMERYKRDVLG